MSFEPQKFFVGLIDFFAVWIPGALLTYFLSYGPVAFLAGKTTEFKELHDPKTVIVFLFASYLLGHFIFLVGSLILDGCVYEPIRTATPSRLTKRLAKGKSCSGKLARFLATWLVKKDADVAVDRAKKIKKHYLDPLEASSAVNAFQWCKARLMLEKPQALETVQRFEADSKFFRSLLIVLGILLVWALIWNWLLIVALVPLIVLAFWRYIEQRLKATNQAFWYIITLECQRENGYRPPPSIKVNGPSHAGGAVYRKRKDRIGKRKNRTEKRKDRIEYLLIQARKSKDHWVLPKGHIKRGESPQEAAVREVHEETAVWAVVEEDLGVTSFAHEETTQEVQFYLMRAATKAKRREGRHYVWLPLEEAVSRATHSESRSVLMAAEKKLALLP